VGNLHFGKVIVCDNLATVHVYILCGCIIIRVWYCSWKVIASDAPCVACHCNYYSIVGENFTAKLSDFGLARGVHEKDYYKVVAHAVLPVRWLAPESLLYGKFSSASDVWWGII